MRTRETDVIVGGGGMVGLTLALALAQGGMKVAVADPVPAAALTDAKFDGRVSALAYASVRMYQALGVWPDLDAHAQPINDILVTDAMLDRNASPFSLHFDHREIGEPLGRIVENRFIRTALYKAAEANPGITLISPAAMTALEHEANCDYCAALEWRKRSRAACGCRRWPRLRDARCARHRCCGLVLSADRHRRHGRTRRARTMAWPMNISCHRDHSRSCR